MSVEKWWNEISGKGKREKPREKPNQTPFRPPRNPHGGTETRTRDPSGGRRAIFINKGLISYGNLCIGPNDRVLYSTPSIGNRNYVTIEALRSRRILKENAS